jgi:hypothetical protein
MNGIVYDTSKVGFEAVLRVWQLRTLQVLWSSPEGAKSLTVWMKVNKMLEGETISRASIINCLEVMREMGILKGEEKSGKGGYHWIYYPAMEEAGFREFIVEKMIATLMESFPEETREAIKRAYRVA